MPPIYDWACDACGCETSVVRPMSEHDLPLLHLCRMSDKPEPMRRVLNHVNVMTHALPDGTRRFDGIRKARDDEREKSERRHAKHKQLVDLARQKEAI